MGRTMGKKQTRKTIMTFGRRPKPNHEMNNGAKAIFGVISILTKNGYMVLRKIDEKVMCQTKGDCNNNGSQISKNCFKTCNVCVIDQPGKICGSIDNNGTWFRKDIAWD